MRASLLSLALVAASSSYAFNCTDLALFGANVAARRDDGATRENIVGATETLFGDSSMLAEVARDAFDSRPLPPLQNAQAWFVACQMRADSPTDPDGDGQTPSVDTPSI